MLRRRYGVSLSRPQGGGEDVNPNSYLSSMADCMLVLILGLLVALIARYNVDLQQAPVDEDAVIGVEVNLDENDDGLVDDSFEERGSVYYDGETGKYYFVTD